MDEKLMVELLTDYSISEIENASIKLFLTRNNITKVKNELINKKINKINTNLYTLLNDNIELDTINSLDKFFENLFTKKQKTKNGIVFTPNFIADYIVQNTIEDINENTKIIDPSCGCGIFLISALEHLKIKTDFSIKNIIKNNLYGIDIKQENIERVKILISLYAIINDQDNEKFDFNLKRNDSLFCDWNESFQVENFNYIIGNPPYINNHDLENQYIEKLKENFDTTQEGTFNIFYAFIEKSNKHITETGKIGYIIPNNFLHIKSARKLRVFIKENKLLNKIIDFKDNLVFSPVLTYNSIIFLSKNNEYFKFAQVLKKEKNESVLDNILFESMSINFLNDSGWILTNNKILNNIQQIESYNKIGDYIKTGIATLRDKQFILDGYDKERDMYFKYVEKEKFFIEKEITKPFIKIPKYNKDGEVDRIIFPYYFEGGKHIVYDEKTLLKKFPSCYKYFVSNKSKLEKKDKNVELSPWYIYGRSQGLNLNGQKIIFSTFNEKPNFKLLEHDDALISNGYCITNFPYKTSLLLKILNSKIMEYYINYTSYSISGNYKCYQKKFLKNFSIPNLDDNTKELILSLENKKLNEFLFKLYDLEG